MEFVVLVHLPRAYIYWFNYKAYLKHKFKKISKNLGNAGACKKYYKPFKFLRVLIINFLPIQFSKHLFKVSSTQRTLYRYQNVPQLLNLAPFYTFHIHTILSRPMLRVADVATILQTCSLSSGYGFLSVANVAFNAQHRTHVPAGGNRLKKFVLLLKSNRVAAQLLLYCLRSATDSSGVNVLRRKALRYGFRSVNELSGAK